MTIRTRRRWALLGVLGVLAARPPHRRSRRTPHHRPSTACAPCRSRACGRWASPASPRRPKWTAPRRPKQARRAASPLTLGLEDAYGNAISCATGTIPIRRITLEQMSKFGTVREFLAKEPGTTGAINAQQQPSRH